MDTTTPRTAQHLLFSAAVAALTGLLLLLSFSAHGQAAVLTQNNDNQRSGANLGETTLTPANVKTTSFGKLFVRNLDDNVNGQPLYVPGVSVPGKGVHNLLIASTSDNYNNDRPSSLYAFDADNPTESAPLWRHQFANSAEWTTCTPVIDPSAGIIYVVTKDLNDSGAARLRAINLSTGKAMPGSPVTIAATVAGTGDGSSGGRLSFDTTQANCRPGLLLINGNVYFAFSHNTDSFPYHGWVFGYHYNGSGFTRVAVFCVDPNGGEGGIWQAGKGLAADSAGNIYLATGNGTFDPSTGSYSMCVVKLTTPGLKVADWFAPWDEQSQSNADL
ncbi:MAG TPA: hypothetical protein VGS41_19065, partial [Chthonomonadales bacterium]|nr:hypothetical protein [Chthonomonadales bacterium]